MVYVSAAAHSRASRAGSQHGRNMLRDGLHHRESFMLKLIGESANASHCGASMLDEPSWPEGCCRSCCNLCGCSGEFGSYQPH
jgi:hypothetical protein